MRKSKALGFPKPHSRKGDWVKVPPRHPLGNNNIEILRQVWEWIKMKIKNNSN